MFQIEAAMKRRTRYFHAYHNRTNRGFCCLSFHDSVRLGPSSDNTVDPVARNPVDLMQCTTFEQLEVAPSFASGKSTIGPSLRFGAPPQGLEDGFWNEIQEPDCTECGAVFAPAVVDTAWTSAYSQWMRSLENHKCSGELLLAAAAPATTAMALGAPAAITLSE